MADNGFFGAGSAIVTVLVTVTESVGSITAYILDNKKIYIDNKFTLVDQ